MSKSKYTVAWCKSQALSVMQDKYKIKRLCTNAANNFSESDLLSLEDADELISRMIDDTLYHEGLWC